MLKEIATVLRPIFIHAQLANNAVELIAAINLPALAILSPVPGDEVAVGAAVIRLVTEFAQIVSKAA